MEELTIGQMFVRDILPDLIKVVGGGLAILLIWLKSKTGKTIRANIKSEGIQKAVTWATGIIMDLVGEAAQTLVRGIKQKLADGKITKAECKELLSEVFNGVFNKAKELTMGRLLSSGAAETVSRVDEIITSKIEASVPPVKAIMGAANSSRPQPTDPPR